MNWIDVTLPISPEMLTWPGDPPVVIRRTSDVAAGDAATVSELTLGSHTGTHVDAPVHFIPGGLGVDRISPDMLCGAVHVADARGHRGGLGAADLEALGIPDDASRLLIKSDNSRLWRQEKPQFPDEYVCVAPDGARWIVERGLVCVGVDFLSVERKGAEGHPTHTTLLGAGIAIVEGLDLGSIDPGRWMLTCLPLRISGCDGAPARALLSRD